MKLALSRKSNDAHVRLSLSVALILSMPLTGSAQTRQPGLMAAVYANAQTPASIPAGTSVVVAINQTLKSGEAKKGQQVTFKVAADAISPDRRTVLIPKGTSGFGLVEQSRSAGAFGRPGSLRIRLDHLVLADGSNVPLKAPGVSASEQGRNRSGAALGTGLMVGAATGLVFAAATAPLDGFSQAGGNRSSISSFAVVAFVGSTLLSSAMTRGGTATIHEGKLFEAITAAEVLRPDPKLTIMANTGATNKAGALNR